MFESKFSQHSRLLGISLALIISAAIILAFFLGYYLTDERYSRKTALVFKAEELALVAGQGSNTAEGLEIRQVSPQGVALVSSANIELSADRYSRLQWRIDGLQPQTDVRFIWKTQAAPTTMRAVPLQSDARGIGYLDLDMQPYWQGVVTGIGLIVYGQLPQPIILQQLELRRPTPGIASLLAEFWGQWTAFEAWSQRSINFTAENSPEALLSPVPTIAAWLGLTGLLYGGWCLLRRRSLTMAPFALCFMIGWLVLDARWQWNLWRQLELTREQFAGKNREAKCLAASDGSLFRFVLDVKKRLPAEPARIWVLSADPNAETRYLRSRVHYHLLPHNVNSSSASLPLEVREGDYVLILRATQNIDYDAKTQTLIQGERAIAVEPVYSAPMGVLFRVRGPDGGA